MKLNLNVIKTVAAFVAPVAISATTSYLSSKKYRTDKLEAELIKRRDANETSYNLNKIKYDEFEATKQSIIGSVKEEIDIIDKESAEYGWKQFGVGLAFAGVSLLTGKKFGWKIGLAVEAVALVAESAIGFVLRKSFMDLEDNLEEMKSDFKWGALLIGGKGIFKYAVEKTTKAVRGDVTMRMMSSATATDIINNHNDLGEVWVNPWYGENVLAEFSNMDVANKFEELYRKANITYFSDLGDKAPFKAVASFNKEVG